MMFSSVMTISPVIAVSCVIATTCMMITLALSPYVVSDPVLHVLVQIPLLIFAGGFLGSALRESFSSNFALSRDMALTLLVIALVTLIFWMLPRSIDAALTDPWVNAAKFITLPLTAGLPLVLCWPYLHPILRGFLKANAISMLGVLSFLYIHAPIRICNSYLVSDQQSLGFGFLYVALGLSLFWACPLIFGPYPTLWERQEKAGAKSPSTHTLKLSG